MPTTSAPFQDLTARIQRQEAVLTKLRHELESRRSQLSKLTRRKEELQAELNKVEKELAAIGQAGGPTPSAGARRTHVKTGGAKAAAKSQGTMSLPAYLVQLVRQAKGPITRKELAEQVVRNKFPTTSKNVHDMVKSRVYELVKSGALRQSGDSGGLVVGQASSSPKTAALKEPAARAKKGNKKARSAKARAAAGQVKPAHR